MVGCTGIDCLQRHDSRPVRLEPVAEVVEEMKNEFSSHGFNLIYQVLVGVFTVGPLMKMLTIRRRLRQELSVQDSEHGVDILSYTMPDWVGLHL